MTRSRGAAPVLAFLLLAAVAFIVPAAAQQVQERIEVEESSLKLVIYPDGAVQPVYKLRAAFVSTEPIGLSSLSLILDGYSKYTATNAESQIEMKLSTTGDLGLDPGSLRAELAAGYSFENGHGWFSAKGYMEWSNATGTYKVSLEELRIESPEGQRLLNIKASLVVPQALVKQEEISGPVPTPAEINDELRRQGITYITVEEFGASLDAEGNMRLTLRAKIDVDEMLRAAMAGGLSREDAERIKSLIYGRYRIEGKLSLSLEARASPSSIDASLVYRSDSVGDVARVAEMNALLTPLLQKMTLALMAPLMREEPQVAIAITQLGAEMGPALAVVPPSESRFHVEVSLAGPNRVSIYVDYQGDRLSVAGLGDVPPSERAGRTLTAISTSLSQMLQSIGFLEMAIPGVSQLLPTTVELEPKPGVEVSTTRARITELPAVRVSVQQAAQGQQGGGGAAATTTPPKTETRTVTQTATVPPATGSPAAGGATGAGTVGGTAPSGQQPAATATTAPAQQPAGQTATQGQQGGAPTTLYIAAAILAAAVVVALVILRR